MCERLPTGAVERCHDQATEQPEVLEEAGPVLLTHLLVRLGPEGVTGVRRRQQAGRKSERGQPRQPVRGKHGPGTDLYDGVDPGQRRGVTDRQLVHARITSAGNAGTGVEKGLDTACDERCGEQWLSKTPGDTHD